MYEPHQTETTRSHADRLTNKVCVVTGAGSGIGRAIAHRLAAERARVVVAEVDRNSGAITADEIRGAGGEARFVRTDVTDVGSVSALIEDTVTREGALDVLVNNAGANLMGDPLAGDDDLWDRCLDLNLKSMWTCIRHAGAVMRERGGGSVVNVASIHAFQTSPGAFPYAAAKAGVIGLTRVLALDFAPHGIRVNALCPGWTDTPPVRAALDDSRPGWERRRAVVDRHPLGRIGRPDEIAAAAAFLASDDASFVTATTLLVDGGLSATFG